MVVCHLAQEAGAPHSWVYWQEEQLHNFHVYVTSCCLYKTKRFLLWRCPPLSVPHIPNFKWIIPGVSEIKTHSSVLCGPRSWRTTPVSILTGRTIMQFSHIHNFMLERNRTIFAVEMPSTGSTPHFKFQLNCARRFRDMNFQKLA